MNGTDGKVEIVLTVGDREYRRSIGTDATLLDQFGAKVGSTAARFSLLKTAIGSTFGLFSAGAIGAHIINTASQFEGLNAQLLTVEKSEPRARLAFQRIQEFASSTPFELQEVVQAFIDLRNKGLDPSSKSLTAYGNIAAGTKKSLDQVIEAVADASTGEFERLKEFGIQTQKHGDKVRFTFRGVVTEVANSSRDIEQYLQRIGLQDFAGGMTRQMETLSGASSNLGDSIAALALRIDSGTGLTGALKAGMHWATGLINELASVQRPLADIEADIGRLEQRIAKLPKTGRGSAARSAAQGELDDVREERLQSIAKSTDAAAVAAGVVDIEREITMQRQRVADAVAKADDGTIIKRRGQATTQGGDEELRRLRELEELLRKATARRKELTESDASAAAEAKKAEDAARAAQLATDRAAAGEDAAKKQAQLQKSIAETLRQRELEARLIGNTSEAARLQAEIELGMWKGWQPGQLEKLRLLAAEKDSKDALLEADKQRQKQAEDAAKEARQWVDRLVERAQKPAEIRDVQQDIRGVADRGGFGVWTAVNDRVDTEQSLEGDRFAAEQAKLAQLKDKKLLADEDYFAAKEQLAKEHEDRLTAITQAGEDAKTILRRNAVDTLTNLGDQFQNSIFAQSERGFKVAQAISIVEATMQTYKNAVAAYGALVGIPYVGPVLAVGAAGAAVAMGAAQIAAISAQRFTAPGRRYGGDLGRGMHPVTEGGRPELLERPGGNFYLLDPGARVSPAKPVASSARANGPPSVINNAPGLNLSWLDNVLTIDMVPQLRALAVGDGRAASVRDAAEGRGAARTLLQRSGQRTRPSRL